MDDNADAKRILLAVASAPVDWRRQRARSRITWLSTIQQDLRHHHLTITKAADLAQNRSLWRMMYVWCYTVLELHARNDDEKLHALSYCRISSANIFYILFYFILMSVCSFFWCLGHSVALQLAHSGHPQRPPPRMSHKFPL